MTRLTAFVDDRIVARGTPAELAETLGPDGRSRARLFDDETGRVAELTPSGLAEPPRGRGRPRLGVVPREVTLLPRHWDWLARQPGGASAAIRRLVEAASKAPPSPEARREAAHLFLTETCGDRPGYEEALRALYRGDEARLDSLLAAWPEDIAGYAKALLGRA